MHPGKEQRFEDQFAAWLRKVADGNQPGTLAVLRRYLTMEPERTGWMHRYLGAWLTAVPQQRQEQTICLVAALFAWHPKWWPAGHKGSRNLGASLALVIPREHRWEKREIPQALESRFQGLLACHPDDLARHLRWAIGLLKTADLPVDWGRLLQDIQRWNQEGSQVQAEWARAFWGVTRDSDQVTGA